MICYHHNKDLDGFSSGAIVKLKYPNVELRGWDYADEVPDIQQLKGEEVILIDITFPLDTLIELGKIAKLTVIDHHISFKKQVDAIGGKALTFTYIYDATKAACEIGWQYFFPDEGIPTAISLLGEYDTWRGYGSERWNKEVYPFQFFMRIKCTSPETFEPIYFKSDANYSIAEGIDIGTYCVAYERTQNELEAKRGAFEVEAFGYRVLAINKRFFGSDTLNAVYNENKHDVLVGFEYTNKGVWSVSLRTKKDGIDVSAIAKERGGGGHLKAAGYQVTNFEDLFK